MSKKKKKTKNTAKKTHQATFNSKQKKPLQSVQTLESAQKKPKDYIAWALAALAAILYLNTLGHQYAFDDSIVISNNSFTLQGLSGIYDLMTRDFFEGIYGEQGMNLSGGRYRPLSLVMFAIEAHFFPGQAWVGHFVNITLYAFSAALLYKVLLLWLTPNKTAQVLSFITALLFVSHPTHTEVVANIKSRDEILGILFLLLSLKALYQYISSTQRLNLVVACLCFLLAMLSKENAFTYVVIFPLFLYVFLHKSLKSSLISCLPIIATAVFYVALRSFMLHKEPVAGTIVAQINPDIMENPFVGADVTTWLATIGLIMWKYIALLLVPYPLSCDYSFNQIPWTNFSNPQAILGWLFYIGIGLYATINIWKRDALSLAILMYLAPLSLVLNLFFNIGAPMADRFLYAPSLGFCLAVALLLAKYLPITKQRLKEQPIYFLVALAVVVLLFSSLTIQRNSVWENNYKLFSNDVQVAHNSAKMHYYFANTLLKKFLDKDEAQIRNPDAASIQLLDSAELHFSKSYEINPKFHHSTYNLGLVNIYKKQAQEALKWLQYTLELQPNHGISHEQLVRVYGEFLNQPDKALEHLNIALSTIEGQKNASNYQYLGNLMAMKGNIEAAEEAFIKAASMRPSFAKSCYRNLAGMYGNLALQAAQAGNQALSNQYQQKSTEYQQKSSGL